MESGGQQAWGFSVKPTLNTFLPLAVAMIAFAVMLVVLNGQDRFTWDWRQAEELGPSYALRSAKLAERDKTLLQAAIVEKLSHQNLSAEDLQDFALRTAIKMVDLNNDGKPEIIAQGSDPYNCSPTGNCPFWVFQKRASGYASLLESFGQTYTIQNHRTNGYRDLVVAMHGSATEQMVKIYHFRNGKYVRAGCYEYSWPFLDGEPPRTAEKPEIVHCR
jgi:hypothetical protein